MSDEPFVSVVTPFFDTGPYIRQCIECVLAQSHQNFEYILVDNQSTDGSTEIALEFARRDSRIRYVRTERFLSQLANYNFALGHMSPAARYCKLALADDWLFPRCVSELVAAAEQYPTSGVVSSYLLAETQVWGSGLPAPNGTVTFMSGREAARQHLLLPVFLFGSPNTVLFRADIVRARVPFYEDGRFHADTEVIYEILRDNDFAFVHQVLSFVRMQEGSLSWQSRAMNPAELDRLIVTKRFGPVFLTPSEYDACARGAEDWFYAGLARQWLRSGLRFDNAAYWERQRVGLGGVGEKVRAAPFARGVASVVLKGLLAPLERLRRVRPPG